MFYGIRAFWWPLRYLHFVVLKPLNHKIWRYPWRHCPFGRPIWCLQMLLQYVHKMLFSHGPVYFVKELYNIMFHIWNVGSKVPPFTSNYTLYYYCRKVHVFFFIIIQTRLQKWNFMSPCAVKKQFCGFFSGGFEVMVFSTHSSLLAVGGTGQVLLWLGTRSYKFQPASSEGLLLLFWGQLIDFTPKQKQINKKYIPLWDSESFS